MLDNLTDPNELQFEAAYWDGKLNWHRRDKINPYLIDGFPICASWWFWDFGRREGAFMHGVALAKAERYKVSHFVGAA